MKIDYLLMVELTEAFHQLEREHNWDLSSGEIAKLLEVFYQVLVEKIPRGQADLNELFECAFRHLWGKDHECDQMTREEFQTFIFALSDSIVERGIDFGEFISGILDSPPKN